MPSERIIGFLGRFWFQMPRMARMPRRARHRAGSGFMTKKNCWEPIVSAMSKNKWHKYCVFETPNRWEPIVVTIDFVFLHTLQHFLEVIFHFCIPYMVFERSFSPFCKSPLVCSRYWGVQHRLLCKNLLVYSRSWGAQKRRCLLWGASGLQN